jgi:5S rRNA maturation endonuclease (ribonuclease M5)
LILHKLHYDDDVFYRRIEDMLAEKEIQPFNEWENIDVNWFHLNDARNGFPARSYFMSRGLSQKAYQYFKVGYANKMMVIPVFDLAGKLIGVIGRSINEKRYKYSKGLQKGNIIWNLHNVVNSDHIVLTEGALDAIAIWDAGVRHVGAILGGHISEAQFQLLRRFAYVVAFFDNDEAGRAATLQLMDRMPLQTYLVEYPDGVKDPGEMTKEQIINAYLNRQDSFMSLNEEMIGNEC